jgi:prolyl oligopeptidase
MPPTMMGRPLSSAEPVTDFFYGVAITDPYRWLEDGNSGRTRDWLDKQGVYARGYLDAIAGRKRIRQRVHEFLAVETYDSLQKAGSHYIYRKRLPNQEQHAIYVREGTNGPESVLIDPASRGTGKLTSVKPLRVSPDGRLLLYEVKQGGERTATFELLEIETRLTLPDALPRGLLRGFAFAPDGKSFCYVHEPLDAARPFYRAVYHHVLGTRPSEDQEIFCAGEDQTLRLFLFRGETRFGICVQRLLDKTYTSFFVREFGAHRPIDRILAEADYAFEPLFANDRLFALTDRDAPNRKIVEVVIKADEGPQFREVVPQDDAPISQWAVAGEHIFVSHAMASRIDIQVFDFAGRRLDDVPTYNAETVRLVGPAYSEELCFESESFTEPISLWRYEPGTRTRYRWAKRDVPFDPSDYCHERVCYTSKDGTRVPMFLMGRRDVLAGNSWPTVMTSYGGYGLSMTPKFSVLVASLVERGCVFALPNIRGGSEFGVNWHIAGKRRNRQKVYDDFVSAAEWLIATGRTTPDRLAIFGGSNAGLLVGAALTQRPDLFRAVLCIAPLLDMLRYHLFDEARIWKDEFGTADDPDDFAVLANYSPYHRVENGVSYPATMIVSGDADTNCNPMHARKMTARLQEANTSRHPIFLDYNRHRGHSPVLPLSERVNALTDRIAFLCDQLQLAV